MMGVEEKELDICILSRHNRIANDDRQPTILISPLSSVTLSIVLVLYKNQETMMYAWADIRSLVDEV
jgi:hypothetical protein